MILFGRTGENKNGESCICDFSWDTSTNVTNSIDIDRYLTLGGVCLKVKVGRIENVNTYYTATTSLESSTPKVHQRYTTLTLLFVVKLIDASILTQVLLLMDCLSLTFLFD